MRNPNQRSRGEVPHWVENPEDLETETSQDTRWVPHPANQRSPQSAAPRSPRSIPPRDTRRSGGSNVASLIPRRPQSLPEIVVVPAGPSATDRALKVLSAGAALSSAALLGTGLFVGAVVVLALLTTPDGALTTLSAPAATTASTPARALNLPPLGTRASALPPTSPGSRVEPATPRTWVDSLVDAGRSLVGSPVAPLPAASLAVDDGLDAVGAKPAPDRSGGFGTAAAPGDPAIGMLAELERPAAAPQTPFTVLPPSTVLPPLTAPPGLANAAPAPVAGGPLAVDDGLDSVAAAPAPDRTGGFGTAAPVDDPTARMLAELDRPLAPAAPAAAPTADSWMDTLSDVGSSLRALVTGDPAPAPAPALAPLAPIAAPPSIQGNGSRSAESLAATAPPSPAAPSAARSGPLLVDDGLDAVGAAPAPDRSGGFGSAAAANDPAMQMLAELDRPIDPPRAAPTTPPVADSWMDTLSGVGSSLAALVSDDPPVSHAPVMAAGTSAAAPAAAPPSIASAPLAPSGPLAVDDGLDAVGAAPANDRSGGFATAAAANDPAMQMLADLDKPLPAAAPSRPAPAPAAAPAGGDSWMDTLSDVGSSLAAMVSDEPPVSHAPSAAAAAAAPVMAPGTSIPPLGAPLAVDDGLDSLVAAPVARPPSASDPAMQMLADLDRPLDAPAPPRAPTASPSPAAPAAPAGGGSWLDTLSDVGSSLASMIPSVSVSGPGPRAPSAAAAAAAPPSVAARAAPPAPTFAAGPLAVDDGLDSVLGAPAADRTGGFGSDAKANDPAMQMLAELDRPVPGAVPVPGLGPSPSGSDDWLADVPASSPRPPPAAAQAAAPAAARAAPPAGDSWMDTLSGMGQSLVAAMTPPPPQGLDPVPVGAPTTVAAAADDSWYASLQGNGFRSAESLRGGPAASVRPVAVGTAASPSLGDVDGSPLGASAASQAALPPGSVRSTAALPQTSEGRPGVDLIGEDDGMAALDTRTADKTGGFGTAARTPDASDLLLAELDTPSGAAPPPPKAAPAGASDDSWLGTLSSLGTAMLGGTSGPSAASSAAIAPGTRVAPGTGPAPAPNQAVALDDGLDAVVAELPAERSGWQSAASADDPALAILSTLDAPTGNPSTGRPAPPSDDSWLGTLQGVGSSVASIVSGTPAVVPSRVAPGTGGDAPPPAPGIRTTRSAADDGWLASVSAMSSSIASYVSGTPANAPSIVNDGPSLASLLAPSSGTASAARAGSVRPGAAAPGSSVDFAAATSRPGLGDPSPAFRISAPPPVAEDTCPDELCGDLGLIQWSDPYEHNDLLQVDEGFSEVQTADAQSVDGFFYDPSDDGPAVDFGGVESIQTLVLRISVDARDVPIELDGRPIGLAPMTTQTTPGSHIVKLYAGSQASGFMINAAADPSEWCFESRGRSFKNVRCP